MNESEKDINDIKDRFKLHVKTRCVLDRIKDERAKKADFDAFRENMAQLGFPYEEFETTEKEIDDFFGKYKEKMIETLQCYLLMMKRDVLNDYPLDELFKQGMEESGLTLDDLGETEESIAAIFTDYFETYATQCLKRIESGDSDFLDLEAKLKECLKKGNLSMGDLETEGSTTSEEELNAHIAIRGKGLMRYLGYKMYYLMDSGVDPVEERKELKKVLTRLKELGKIGEDAGFEELC